MSNPTSLDEVRLKRVARFLKTVPRRQMQFPWRPLSSELEVFVDADHAGCHRTRKSTLGGAILWSRRYLKGWSKTMDIIALSTGESELAAVVKGATEGLGLQSVLRDFGFETSVHLLSDATAAIGIVKRLGLGRVRHLAVGDLWIQQRLRHQRESALRHT